jgi:hypothetical protein
VQFLNGTKTHRKGKTMELLIKPNATNCTGSGFPGPDSTYPKRTHRKIRQASTFLVGG